MPGLDLEDNIIKNARGFIYKTENGQKLFLLTQEQDGCYTLPGGCKDMEDKDLLSAIKREMKEELGLEETVYEISETAIQKTYKNRYADPTSERFGKDTTISLFIVRCNNDQSIKAGHEIKSVQWFNEEAAYKALKHDHMRELFQLGIKMLQRKGGGVIKNTPRTGVNVR